MQPHLPHGAGWRQPYFSPARPAYPPWRRRRPRSTGGHAHGARSAGRKAGPGRRLLRRPDGTRARKLPTVRSADLNYPGYIEAWAIVKLPRRAPTPRSAP
jgi:hypothetical protein